MNKGTGIVAAVIGAIGLIGAALVTGVFSPDSQTGPGPAPAPPGQKQVDVTIYDELGDNQYSESLNVEIDGTSKGDLIIQSQTRPQAEMTFSLAPGSHNYELSGTTQALAADGSTQQFPVVGKGNIDVLDEDNQSFAIVQTGVANGNTLVEELQKSY
jgi:hypothetical protein